MFRVGMILVCLVSLLIVAIYIYDRLPLTAAERALVDAYWNPVGHQVRGLEEPRPTPIVQQGAVSFTIDTAAIFAAISALLALIGIASASIAFLTKYAMKPMLVDQDIRTKHLLDQQTRAFNESIAALDKRFYVRSERAEDYPTTQQQFAHFEEKMEDRLRRLEERGENLHRRVGNLEMKAVDLEVKKADRSEMPPRPAKP